MRATNVRAFIAVAIAALVGSIAAVESHAAAPQDAARAGNPVAASPESVAAGLKVYQRYCRACHGSNGEGGPAAEAGPAPPSLVDAKWDTGSSDAAIFTVIQKGIGPDFYMEPWNDRINETDTWHLVNYIRTLAKK